MGLKLGDDGRRRVEQRLQGLHEPSPVSGWPLLKGYIKRQHGIHVDVRCAHDPVARCKHGLDDSEFCAVFEWPWWGGFRNLVPNVSGLGAHDILKDVVQRMIVFRGTGAVRTIAAGAVGNPALWLSKFFLREADRVLQGHEALGQMDMAMLVKVPQRLEHRGRFPGRIAWPRAERLQPLKLCVEFGNGPKTIQPSAAGPVLLLGDDRELNPRPLTSGRDRNWTSDMLT